MVNENVPPVATNRDSVSVGDNSVSTPSTSSVDLSSRKDSDIAKAISSPSGPTPDFLNNLTIQMDDVPTGDTTNGMTNGTGNPLSNWMKDGPYKPNQTSGDGSRKDGPYSGSADDNKRINDGPYSRSADDNKRVNDGPYTRSPGDNRRVNDGPYSPGADDNKGTNDGPYKPNKTDSIKDRFPELFPKDRDRSPKGINPIGKDSRDQTPGRKPSWLDGPQPIGVAPIGDPANPEPIGLAPIGGSFSPEPIGLAPIDDDSPTPEAGGISARELVPNGNHPRGGGGDNTGGAGHDTKPRPSADSEVPSTTDPSESSQQDANSIVPDRALRTQGTMARWHRAR